MSQQPTSAQDHASLSTQDPQKGRSAKSWIVLGLKMLISFGIMAEIFRRIAQRDGAHELFERLGNLSWGWMAVAVLMQLCAIGFSIVRWQRLLEGQGIHAPFRFLTGSFFIARFFGAVSPGGFTGLGGWRIYDIHKQTGKTARATATIGVEMFLGQMAMGLVVMGCSFWGIEFVGQSGVILINAFFAAVVTVAFVLLTRPAIFRWAADFLPRQIRGKVQTLVDAICGYQGKGRLLLQALLLGIGTHSFNSLIYVSAARALQVELSVGMVFFASTLQILSTLVPASINGIGLREATAVALYTSAAVGLSPAVAVLIPITGFAAEMFVSMFGGLIYVMRKGTYTDQIRVDDPDREQMVQEAQPEVTREDWPKVAQGLKIGLAAGLLGGALVGLAEGVVTLMSAAGDANAFVLTYGALLYGLVCAVLWAKGGALLAFSGRILRREAFEPERAYAYIAGGTFAAFAFVIGVFRLKRDVFNNELKIKSLTGLAVLGGSALVAFGLFVGLQWLLARFARSERGRFLLTAWGTPTLVAGLIALTLPLGAIAPGGATSEVRRVTESSTSAAADEAPHTLVIVVDTLRADALPSYGYDKGATPNVDAFLKDAIRFDQAFANASWTRPSFASILSGRLPENHGVMGQFDALPDELMTMAEVFQGAGYYTAGVVTNPNVTPTYQYDQGFLDYTYLEPDFPLGADDTSSKLALFQVLRRVVEKAQGGPPPATTYQDAETVNQTVFKVLDEAPQDRPMFLFVGYMDPHDPYFEHPYGKPGFARATNVNPDPALAPELRRLYDGEITYWDEHFGALMADLKRRGLYDKMTIVVTSDHGEEFHEHGGFWHGTTLYDEQIRVPMLVKLPSQKRAGTAVTHWAQSIDIMPTVLEVAGLETPEAVQGHNMLQNGHEEVLGYESHQGNVLHSLRTRIDGRDVKIITANPDNPRGLEPVELYRVDDDVAEQHNLAGEETNLAKTTEGRLEFQRERARKGAAKAGTVHMSPAEAARLRALGYAEEETPSEAPVREAPEAPAKPAEEAPEAP